MVLIVACCTALGLRDTSGSLRANPESIVLPENLLFAGIIKELGFGVCLINPPGHVAVGVLGSEEILGTYYTLNGKRYYYCETTGSNWEIGDCPDEFKNVEATLIEL